MKEPATEAPACPKAEDRSSGHRYFREPRGFTLVELLVVIGIIAVLIGILIPTVGAARRQGQLLQCMSNSRQVLTATMLHAADHGGYAPLAGRCRAELTLPIDIHIISRGLRDANRKRYTYAKMIPSGWFVPVPFNGAIMPYLANKLDLPTNNWDFTEDYMNKPDGPWRVFRCPSAASFDRGTYVTSGLVTPVEQGTVIAVILGTSATPQYIWSSNLDFVLNEGVLGYSYNGTGRRMRGLMNLVKRPDRTMLFTDGKRRPEVPEVGLGSDGWQVWTPLVDGPAVVLTLADALATTPSVNSPKSFDRVRHRGKINVTFVDGHVETRLINSKDLANVYVLPPR